MLGLQVIDIMDEWGQVFVVDGNRGQFNEGKLQQTLTLNVECSSVDQQGKS